MPRRWICPDRHSWRGYIFWKVHDESGQVESRNMDGGVWWREGLGAGGRERSGRERRKGVELEMVCPG